MSLTESPATATPSAAVNVGVISDTHGLMRPEALAALAGSDLIIHAGDIGSPEVVTALEHIAPVHAIRGNVDRADWALRFSETLAVEAGGLWLWVLHDVKTLDLDPSTAGFAAVISGHSHKPSEERKKGVLYLNPGSAGPRRFRLPVSLARLMIDNREPRVEMIELQV